MRIDDRLTSEKGTYFFSGISMLVRLPIEQAQRDSASGLKSGTLVTGYPGSPLASVDLQLSKIPELLSSNRIHFIPAGNEEQAVTALMGSQMLDSFPHSEYEGVTGIWYGKGPGADRSGDALKHGNFAGTSSYGSVVLLSGEDHEAKSSTMPFQQDYGYVSAGIPILYPSSIAEFRTLGLHAIALSRYSGCWVALKLTSALCDGGDTVTIDPEDVSVIHPDLDFNGEHFAKRADFSFYPGKNIKHERHLYRERHAAVLAYARANDLNRVISRHSKDRIGVITAGKSAADVRQALSDLGLNPSQLQNSGVALLNLGLIYPLDEDIVRKFCDGLDQVIVIEEKRSFMEDAIRAAIQPLTGKVQVIGKQDENGKPLFPIEGGMDSDSISPILGRYLKSHIGGSDTPMRLSELEALDSRPYPSHAPRTPNFCSGCPHSTSTVLAEGQVAFGAPGCHCFNEVIEQPKRHIDTMTHFGGEGAPWVGLAPFTDRKHLVQHVGDGSLYHSSYLNIRWAVATGTRITFKVLWNGVIANTGAQRAPGEHGLAALTRGLESEGVSRIVICSKDPKQYRKQRLGRGVEVRHASELVGVSKELESVDGVTVLVYDESCANERRRRIKRGLLAPPTEYVLINKSVCEACGDCGVQSNCMSLQKVPTEFGAKVQVHASSCNQDLSCLSGDCPSFTTIKVRAGTGYRKPKAPPLSSEELIEPPKRTVPSKPFNIYMPGVGGTGVLTINAILCFAGLMDGYRVTSYDQTGAAQKWGPVLSSLKLVPDKWPDACSNKVGKGQADVYLALDEVASVTIDNLSRCSSQRTAAIINTDLFPTGEMVRNVWHEIDTAAMRSEIAEHVLENSVYSVPARTIAEKLFGDYMMTNVVAIGAAYQAGLLPLSSTAIEAAIELNGVGVGLNTAAFRYGRLWIQDPSQVLELIEPRPKNVADERTSRAAALSPRRRNSYEQFNTRIDDADLDNETRRLLAVRVADLIDYQSESWANHYLDKVLNSAINERKRSPDAHDITDAIVRNLYKLMAYKDEYEVARLYSRPEWKSQIQTQFDQPAKVFYHLHPPAARKLGRKKKIRLGPWFTPFLRILSAGRRLRGTFLDPFGWQATRRQERELIEWYVSLIGQALIGLRPLTYSTVLSLAEIPDLIRGYENIKSDNIEKAKARASELLEALERPKLPLGTSM